MKSLLHLNKYFVKYKWQLLWGILIIAVSKIFAIYPAMVVRHAFDAVLITIRMHRLFEGSGLQQEVSSALTTKILWYTGLIIGSSIIYGIMLFFTRQTIIIMSRLIEYDLKNEIFAHYQQLSLAFYKRNNTGDLMNRISEDVSHVRMYLGPAIMYTINLLIMFILVLGTMVSVNAELTLYCLLPLPILSISIYFVSSRIHQRSEAVQGMLSKLSTHAQEAFSGIRILKAYVQQDASASAFRKQSESYRSHQMDLIRIDAIFHPMMMVLIGLSTILTVYVGGRLAIAGDITAGNIAEFVIYVNMLTWPVAAVGWVTSLTQRAAASQKRINEFLHTAPEIINTNTTPQQVLGEIEFENVSFTYPDTGITALSDVSFKVEPGHSLAIFGTTGSGKSTIAQLVARMYDTGSGCVKVDGEDIRQINLNAWRESMGYVPQEVFLFSETIARNIAFGEESEPDRDRVSKAARQSCVYQDIMGFPDQFSTMLGERGINLSGGQKQRISIARALYRKPTVLIFDDCLSAVDTQTESVILKNLQDEMQGKTTILISHRISTVRLANEILVLHEGRITERGSHDALMHMDGAYAAACRQQALEEMASLEK